MNKIKLKRVIYH